MRLMMYPQVVTPYMELNLMKPDKLFRGDVKGNKTQPEQYGIEGLLTKLINNGDPSYISKAGIVEAIRVHVAPTVEETILWSKSSFLSFSANRQRALDFAAYNKPENLIPGDRPGDGEKQAYLFTLDISVCVATASHGIYSLAYDCSLNIRCKHCTPAKQKHHLLLIDVVTFLSENHSFAKTEDAIENARRDSEWLLLPIDYIPQLDGFHARIVPSAIWDVEHYILLCH